MQNTVNPNFYADKREMDMQERMLDCSQSIINCNFRHILAEKSLIVFAVGGIICSMKGRKKINT